MTPRLSEIWRHPIKAIGRERVAQAVLEPGCSLPFDRHWAVAHERAQIDSEWMSCRNFIRAAGSPALMAVSCTLDETTKTIRLTHPDRPDLVVQPEADPDALIAWLEPLVTEGRPRPVSVHALPGRGYTDSGTAGVTIANAASHRAVEQRLGRPISRLRWRANLWFDGLAPWEEFDFLDRDIQIGSVRLHVYGRTERCRATEANPDTGRRDTDTLGALREWDHQDFTVKAKVIAPGTIAEGDTLEVL